MKRGVLRKSILTMGLLTIMGATTAFAAYGSYGTAWVNSSTSGYKMHSNISSKKTTIGTGWSAEVTSKTMWTTPSGKLVNSNGASRSNATNLKVTTNYGSGNSGSSGYTYYIGIKPAWNQTGSDAIRLRINAD